MSQLFKYETTDQNLPKAVEASVINDEYFQHAHDAALYLAEIRWTIPMEWTLTQIREIQIKQTPNQDAEKILIKWYKQDNYAALKKLEQKIIKDHDFCDWNGILREIFSGFHVGFRVALVPALLTVIEGVLARKVGTTDIKMKDPTSMMATRQFHSVLDNIIWISLSRFIEKLYESSDFKSNSVPTLNRHWILHGRDQRAWGEEDCLKLFNFLGTLSSAPSHNNSTLVR
jgi:hypothetical protein